MGDTNMNTEDELRAFDELYGDLSPHNETKTNEGNGDSNEDSDCTIDDKQKAQFQARTRHGITPDSREANSRARSHA